MRATWELTAGGFRRHSRYRMGILAAMVANIMFGMIRASLLVATIEAAGAPVAGYDRLTAITYVWIGQALLGPIDLWGGSGWEMNNRVKQGDLVTDLLRPVHPLLQWTAQEVGRAASQVLPRFVPMLVVGALLTGLRLPTEPLSYLLFLWALLVAVVLSHTAWLLVGLLALWVVEVRGYLVAMMVVANLFSGLLIPVQWFPTWARGVIDHSPFRHMFQTPIDLLTGLADGRRLVLLAEQLAWALTLLALAALVLRRGGRKLEVQGG
ncbi:ABC transporter permease [Aestuariimicrobium ganziense]|uniref:ABC transporter permease n=1 Tax=Aestuariimicrobium ganziense TaxID=2773677 RepID=UPI001943AE11|nr:ABC-2 family transporter protein [Aestuariimicrobium ganziense]